MNSLGCQEGLTEVEFSLGRDAPGELIGDPNEGGVPGRDTPETTKALDGRTSPTESCETSTNTAIHVRGLERLDEGDRGAREKKG